jgi:hypothetical protein
MEQVVIEEVGTAAMAVGRDATALRVAAGLALGKEAMDLVASVATGLGVEKEPV